MGSTYPLAKEVIGRRELGGTLRLRCVDAYSPPHNICCCALAAVGDVNNDGRTDVITANKQSNTVSVLLGVASSTYLASARVLSVSGNGPADVALIDTDGDGQLDIATANEGSDTVSILIGYVTGSSLRIKALHSTGLNYSLLSLLQWTCYRLGDGTFKAPWFFAAGAGGASSLAIGAFFRVRTSVDLWVARY